MPVIRSSAELRNTYNEISKLCHEYNEPVFITKNGNGDLAVMSIEAYENFVSRMELLEKLAAGTEDVNNGRVSDAKTAFDELERLIDA